MEEYKVDKLKEYVENSELVVVNDNFRIRLSKELLEKYNQGLFDDRLSIMIEHIELIKSLGIKYPDDVNPIFYLYIVPKDNFRELLNFPSYRNYKGGGKPVVSYDLDGFNKAFGLSDNALESKREVSIMWIVSNIHEFAHLVHGMFFNEDRIICEGFAEALPLYTMDYESIFDEHREMLKTLTENQVLSAQELIKLEENNNFQAGAVTPDKSCGFDISYISSYLFVRGCLETISTKFNCDRIQATQRFLEILRQSKNTKQYLIYDIANAIGMLKKELLYGKDLQFGVIHNLSNGISI